MVSRYLDAAGPRVFAHRGFADGVPGNTLAAFRAALEAGASHLESDVRATRDGVPVLFHDEHLPAGVLPEVAPDDAASSSPLDDVAIRTLTLAEVRRIDLGGGHRIPTVAEALDAFPDALWNLDLKAPDAVVATAKHVWRAGAADRVLLTSFSEVSRARAVRLLPGIATSASSIGTAVILLAALTGRPALVRAVTRLLPGTVLALQIPERAGPLPLVTTPLLATLHGAGLEVHVWTVNERSDIRRLLELGVDGIVTDRPDVARAVVDVLDVFEALGPSHAGS
ncbi:glycerophosphodiester phosphodiesterase family protein [Leifsonia sp. ALI-44-B]|uniref:glycerophosphodiester phosphodiesterase family protein n=1 Tax=Leifsonia sp. ALI-44-B TaxID=1933776 RepID=UPI001EE6A394|nr:glycerophosphodiester phosphodiesterase family protein [Leifsonia sp. ALI-44-B]